MANPYAEFKQENPYAQFDKNSPTYADRLRALRQGATFGFGDELMNTVAAGYANLVGGVPFNEAYNQGLQEDRAAMKQYSNAHPVESTVLEIAGGLPTGLGVSKLISKAPIASKAVKGLTDILAQGAAYGAGGGEGTLANRAIEAGKAAVTGAGVAGGVKGVGKVTGKLGINKAVGKVADIIGLRNPTKIAQRELLEKIKLDDMTPEELLAKFEAAHNLDPTKAVVLSDIAGDNVKALAKVSQIPPSKAKRVVSEFLATRAEEQPQRVMGNIAELLGNPDPKYLGQLDEVIAKRQAEAQPFYEAARSHGVLASPEVKSVLDRPYMQHAFKQVVEDAQNAGRAIPLQVKMDASGNPMTDKSGKLVFESLPDLSSLDEIKKGIDALVETNTDALTGKITPKGRTYLQLKRDLLNAVDKEVPDYAQARGIWAGHSDTLNQMEAGRRFLKQDPEQLLKDIPNMSAPELEAYKVGVLKSLQDTVNKSADGRNSVRTLFGSPQKREQLSALFNPDEFEALSKKLDLESDMFANVNPNKAGSQTAPLTAGLNDLNALGAVGNLATGNVLGAVGNVVGAGAKAAQQNLSPKIANELLGQLYTPGFMPNASLLQNLELNVNKPNVASGLGTNILAQESAKFADGGLVEKSNESPLSLMFKSLVLGVQHPFENASHLNTVPALNADIRGKTPDFETYDKAKNWTGAYDYGVRKDISPEMAREMARLYQYRDYLKAADEASRNDASYDYRENLDGVNAGIASRDFPLSKKQQIRSGLEYARNINRKDWK